MRQMNMVKVSVNHFINVEGVIDIHTGKDTDGTIALVLIYPLYSGDKYGRDYRIILKDDEMIAMLEWLERRAKMDDNLPASDTEFKFKVGDTVITTQGLYKSLPLGTVGKITRIAPTLDDQPYIVRTGDDDYDYYAEDEIQLYTEIDATDNKPDVIPDGAICKVCGAKAEYVDNHGYFCNDH